MEGQCRIYFETGHEIDVLGKFDDVRGIIESAAATGDWAYFTAIEGRNEFKAAVKPFAVVGIRALA